MKLPPLDVEATLEGLLASDPTEFHNLMSSHPGRDVCSALDELQSSLDIFKDAVSDFLETARNFNEQSHRPIAWRNLDNGTFTASRRRVLKELFAASASSMALVDHTRRLVNAGFSVLEYDDQVAQLFHGDGLHEFVQGLRNYFSHRKVLPLSYKLRSSKPGNRSFFFLSQNELLAFDNWKPKALEHIKQQQAEIGVEDIFHVYLGRVCEFHNWFAGALAIKYGSAVAEYRVYENILKRASIRGAWYRLVAMANARALDPYAILSSVFTEQELQEVLSLRPRSRQQIDRIIEIFDHHGACDAALREEIYTLFSVENQARNTLGCELNGVRHH